MAANSVNETTASPLTSTLDSSKNVEIRLNQANPIRNPTTAASLPPILQRRPTLPSAEARAKRFFRNHRRRTRPHPTQLSGGPIPAARELQEEGIPAERGVKINLDPKEILQAACVHEKSTVALTGLSSNFPEYDGLNAYFISEDTAKELLKREIDRLVAIVENPEGELRFSNQEILKEGSWDGYKKLSALSHMIMKAVSIAKLDNEVIDLKCGSGISSYRKVAKCLGVVRSGQLASVQNELEPESTEHPDEEGYINASYILVDYVTAVLVRLITQSGSGDYWHNNLVGVLAKLTTKIKVMLLALDNNAPISMMNAEGALEESGQPAADDDEEDDCEEMLLNKNTKEGKASPQDPHIALHCAHQAKFRSGPMTFLTYIFMSLQYLNRSGLPITSYEVCAVVYETGFEGFKVHASCNSLHLYDR